MKSPEEFKSFYDTTLLPTLQELDTLRKKILRASIPFGIIPLGVLGTIIYRLFLKQDAMGPSIIQGDTPISQELMTQNKDSLIISLVVFVFSILLTALLARFILSGKIRNLRNRFKGEVINKMVKFIDESLTYSPDSGISTGEYHKSKIFLTRADRYKAEDMVSGTLGKTAIRFSEIHSEHKTETRNNGKTETKWSTIFRGIFFVGDFNKNFNGITIVLPDTAERLFGGFGTLRGFWNILDTWF